MNHEAEEMTSLFPGLFSPQDFQHSTQQLTDSNEEGSHDTNLDPALFGPNEHAEDDNALRELSSGSGIDATNTDVMETVTYTPNHRPDFIVSSSQQPDNPATHVKDGNETSLAPFETIVAIRPGSFNPASSGGFGDVLIPAGIQQNTLASQVEHDDAVAEAKAAVSGRGEGELMYKLDDHVKDKTGRILHHMVQATCDHLFTAITAQFAAAPEWMNADQVVKYNESQEAALARCVSIINKNPIAARSWCFLTVNSLVEAYSKGVPMSMVTFQARVSKIDTYTVDLKLNPAQRMNLIIFNATRNKLFACDIVKGKNSLGLIYNPDAYYRVKMGNGKINIERGEILSEATERKAGEKRQEAENAEEEPKDAQEDGGNKKRGKKANAKKGGSKGQGKKDGAKASG